MTIEAAHAFFERVLGRPLTADVEPEPISPTALLKILWSLNDIFRPMFHRIETLKYRPSFEPEADAMVESFAATGAFSPWASASPGAWRVLQERHSQMLMVAITNIKAGTERIATVPVGLTEKQKLAGAMLTFLHGMELPWPPFGKSQLEYLSVMTQTMSLH